MVPTACHNRTPLKQHHTAMNIAIDLDDTVLDSASHLCAVLNAHTGLDHRPENMLSYKFDKLYGMSQDQIRQHWIANRTVSRCTWHPGRDVLDLAMRRWLAHDHHVYFVTARAWHPQADQITLSQLEGLACGYQIVDTHESKVQCMKRRGIPIGLLIDDNVVQIEHAQQARVPTLLRSQPWNFYCVTSERIASTTELVNKVDNFINTGSYGKPR